MRSTAQESKANYARCSTGYESASRKLGDAWGIAKGCTSNLAGAEGLKLPSPFTFTVRVAADCVKSFRNYLPESKFLAGLVRYPRLSGLC